MNVLRDIWAIDSDATLHECAVATVLLMHADNESGKAFPSVPRIAAMARISERATQYALDLLAERGVLGRRLRPGRSTVYELRAAVTPAPAAGVAPVTGAPPAPVGQVPTGAGVAPVTPAHTNPPVHVVQGSGAPRAPLPPVTGAPGAPYLRSGDLPSQLPTLLPVVRPGSDPSNDDRKGLERPPVAASPAKPTAPRLRKGAPAAEEPSGHKAVVDAYFAAFKAARGEDPPFGSREGAAVKKLLEAMHGDVERACRIVRAAFADHYWRPKATIRMIADDPARFSNRNPSRVAAPGRARGTPVQRGPVDYAKSAEASAQVRAFEPELDPDALF